MTGNLMQAETALLEANRERAALREAHAELLARRRISAEEERRLYELNRAGLDGKLGERAYTPSR